MSNNKQSMKLYTEEQVLEIIANVNREVNVSSQELLESGKVLEFLNKITKNI